MQLELKSMSDLAPRASEASWLHQIQGHVADQN